MKNRMDTIFIRWRLLLLTIMVAATFFAGEVYGQTGDVALLLQQSPVEGGRINPGAGVHQFELNAGVTLTAKPEPGYQFVYWLGDVSDMTSSSTIVYLDSPKIVIAVFERVEYEVLAASEMSYSTPGGGGLVRGGRDYSRQGYTGGGAKRPHKYRWPTPPERPDEPDEPDEELGDLPVPDEGENYLPVPDEPIPEPATGLLLGFGSLGLLRRLRVKK